MPLTCVCFPSDQTHTAGILIKTIYGDFMLRMWRVGWGGQYTHGQGLISEYLGVKGWLCNRNRPLC